ncbi:hypothetical protein EVJ58_g5418 [Rhodofomes roseus]|uniref:Uncharacterized protein n=1 Tax=Rhodofomes roseus TaxID=34475 RepID=A0A4Y9YE49_9APHY|nr:hypothetical protein EVJ58_g5418 [Rhodofomes roseus]
MSDTQDGSDSDALSNVIVRALGRELKRLRAIHRDAEARIHHLETKVDDVENKYGDLVALSSDLETSHQAALTRTAGLEARNTELEGENMRLQRELDDSRRALLERWIKEEDAQPCILAAGSPYQQVKRALDDSIRQREEERLEHSRVVKILQDDLSEMEGKRDHLTKALALANRDLDAIRSRYPRKVVPVNTSDSESSSDDERAAEVVKDSVSNIRVFAATALADDSDDDESTSDGLPSDKSSEKDEGDGEDENEDEEDEDEEDEEEGEGGDEDEEDDEEDDAEYEGNGINVILCSAVSQLELTVGSVAGAREW